MIFNHSNSYNSSKIYRTVSWKIVVILKIIWICRQGRWGRIRRSYFKCGSLFRLKTKYLIILLFLLYYYKIKGLEIFLIIFF